MNTATVRKSIKRVKQQVETQDAVAVYFARAVSNMPGSLWELTDRKQRAISSLVDEDRADVDQLEGVLEVYEELALVQKSWLRAVYLTMCYKDRDCLLDNKQDPMTAVVSKWLHAADGGAYFDSEGSRLSVPAIVHKLVDLYEFRNDPKSVKVIGTLVGVTDVQKFSSYPSYIDANVQAAGVLEYLIMNMNYINPFCSGTRYRDLFTLGCELAQTLRNQ